MRRLQRTTSTGLLLALIVAFTFTACSKHKSDKNNQQSARPVANKQLSNSKNEELLLGKVINAQTGQAVVHAKVIVTVGGNYDATVTTDRRGLFLVTGVAQGDHLIRVKANGYQFWKNTVYVPSLNKTNAAGPFNGFFMPSENKNGWLHGVFQTSDNNDNPSNLYDKSMFIIIGLQRK